MLLQDLMKAIRDNGVEMSEDEVIDTAYDYGSLVYIEDEKGNIIEEKFRPDFQAVADLFTDNFDCRPYFTKEDVFSYENHR